MCFERGDILDIEKLHRLVEAFRVDGIVHTAALTGEVQRADAQQRWSRSM